jgi:hypothetical protein
MKRTLILCAILGLLAPVGCGETTEVKKVEEVKTPDGTKTITDSHKETDTTKKP